MQISSYMYHTRAWYLDFFFVYETLKNQGQINQRMYEISLSIFLPIFIALFKVKQYVINLPCSNLWSFFEKIIFNIQGQIIQLFYAFQQWILCIVLFYIVLCIFLKFKRVFFLHLFVPVDKYVEKFETKGQITL